MGMHTKRVRFRTVTHFRLGLVFLRTHARTIYANSTTRLSPLLSALQGEGGEGIRAELPADGSSTVGCHTRMHDPRTHTIQQCVTVALRRLLRLIHTGIVEHRGAAELCAGEREAEGHDE